MSELYFLVWVGIIAVGCCGDVGNLTLQQQQQQQSEPTPPTVNCPG